MTRILIISITATVAVVVAAVVAVASVRAFAASSPPAGVVTTERVPGANGHTFTAVAFRIQAGDRLILCVVTEDSAADHSASASQNRPDSLAIGQSCDFTSNG